VLLLVFRLVASARFSLLFLLLSISFHFTPFHSIPFLFNSIMSDDDQFFHLRIKSFKDVEISVPPTSVVAHVKQQVRQALAEVVVVDDKEEEDDDDRHLRLICKGRLLAPDTAPIADFGVTDGDVIHAVLAPLVKGDSASAQGAGHRRRRRNGTVVGPGGRVTRASTNDDGDSSSEENSGDEEQGRERRGFDRLRGSGLSRQEITAIRTYFSRHVDRHVQSHATDHADESDLRQRRWRMEDDWMALQGPTSEFRMNLNQNTLLRFANMENSNWRASVGTDRDFLWGFMLGFFVGFVMLVWVWMPTVPHKQKIGILTGISFNLAMNVLHEGDSENDFVEGE
jgi:uncharacterized ubiquitin-like protein YukD